MTNYYIRHLIRTSHFLLSRQKNTARLPGHAIYDYRYFRRKTRIWLLVQSVVVRTILSVRTQTLIIFWSLRPFWSIKQFWLVKMFNCCKTKRKLKIHYHLLPINYYQFTSKKKKSKLCGTLSLHFENKKTSAILILSGSENVPFRVLTIIIHFTYVRNGGATVCKSASIAIRKFRETPRTTGDLYIVRKHANVHRRDDTSSGINKRFSAIC